MKNSIFYILFLILLILQGKTKSQPTLEWEARYSNGEAKAMTLDKFGNIYVTGYQTLSNGTQWDMCTIKYSQSGQQIWVRIYNGTNNLNDYANAITADDSGNVYITGGSFNGKGQDWDYVTIKYNSDGKQQWVKLYNTPPNGSDIATSIAIDENSNVYVTGGGGGAYVTIKYDRNGTQQWTAQYTGIGGENKANKILYKNNFLYVTGYSTGNNSFWDYATIKYYSPLGTQVWAARYNGNGNQNDEACCIQVDELNNIFVGGSSVGISTSWDFATIKYNSAGILQWINRSSYDSSFGQIMTGLVIDNIGNVYITGNNGGDYLTIKYDLNGAQLWLNNYNSGYSDSPNSFYIDNRNDIYVTGRSQFPPPIRNNIVTLKYNSNGIQQWLINYNSIFSSDDVGNVVFVDSLLNIYIAGKSNNGVNTDILTLKYSQTTGIQQINEFTKKFELQQNYPNPFNSSTTIQFSLPEKTHLKLTLYDILGRNVIELLNRILSPGTYLLNFNAAKLTSGIYFYTLITEKYSISKKLILIK